MSRREKAVWPHQPLCLFCKANNVPQDPPQWLLLRDMIHCTVHHRGGVTSSLIVRERQRFSSGRKMHRWKPCLEHGRRQTQAGNDRQCVWLTVVCVLRLPTVGRPEVRRLMKEGRKKTEAALVYWRTQTAVVNYVPPKTLRDNLQFDIILWILSLPVCLSHTHSHTQSQSTLCVIMSLDVHVLDTAIRGAMVTTFCPCILNVCCYLYFTFVQSSFPSSSIMDGPHLSRIFCKKKKKKDLNKKMVWLRLHSSCHYFSF